MSLVVEETCGKAGRMCKDLTGAVLPGLESACWQSECP